MTAVHRVRPLLRAQEPCGSSPGLLGRAAWTSPAPGPCPLQSASWAAVLGGHSPTDCPEARQSANICQRRLFLCPRLRHTVAGRGVSLAGVVAGTDGGGPPLSAVPSLLEKRRQQASDHAAAEKAIQKPNDLGLQDAGSGLHQHGRGEHILLGRPTAPTVCPDPTAWAAGLPFGQG